MYAKVLGKAASHLESFELIDFIGKHKGLFKVYKYFFPESVKVIEVEVPQEPRIMLTIFIHLKLHICIQ